MTVRSNQIFEWIPPPLETDLDHFTTDIPFCLTLAKTTFYLLRPLSFP